MEASIFTKIIKGEIPCYKVYEDDDVLAILDIYPVCPGHTLVIPKKQIDHFDDLDDVTYQTMFKVVKLISRNMKEVLSAKRACLRIEGFDIPHAHVHVIPCNKAEDFYNDSRMQNEPDHSALADMANKLFILDLSESVVSAGQDSSEIKTVLSEREVAEATSKEEKPFLAVRNGSKELSDLRKSSNWSKSE